MSESRWFLASKIVLGYVIPLAIIIFCYTAIIFKVRQSDTMSNGGHAERTQKTVVVVITVFFFTWLPNHAFNLGNFRSKLKQVCSKGPTITYISVMLVLPPGQDELTSILNGITVIIATFNSCLNPILYAFLKVILKI